MPDTDVKDPEVEETPSTETSPVDDTADAVELFETVDMADLTKAERDTWLASGKVPDRYMPKPQGKPAKDDNPAAAAAKEREKEAAKAKLKAEGKTATRESAEPPDKEGKDDSEPSDKKDQQDSSKQPTRAERRLTQLSAQIQEQVKESKALRESIESQKRELAELAKATPAAKSVVEEKKATGKLVRPKMDDFNTTREYDDAMEAYDTARELEVSERQRTAIEDAIQKDRKEREQAEVRARQEREGKKIEDAYRKQLDAGVRKHPDLMDVISDETILMNTSGAKNAVADSTILELEHGVEVLYWLGLDENDGERARIMDLGPIRTAAELGKIEARIASELKGKPAEDKKPVVPRAPAPPTDLAGKKAAVDDPAEAALERQDFDAYRREQNRKDAAARAARLS